MSQMSPELAPSDVRSGEPTVARVAGMAGLFLLTVGVVSVVAAQWGRGLAGEGLGYLFAALGVVGLFVHAARDTDREVRRLYGLLAVALLIAAVVVGLYPHRPAGAEARQIGVWLPYGVGLGLLALLFLVPFVRNEEEEPYRSWSRLVLLGVGGVLAISAVAIGLIRPEFLVGPGIMLALLGLGYLGAYLTSVDTADGPGYRVAVGLGVVGAVVLVVALARSIVPTVLHEGPAALKTPMQTYDPWLIAARAVSVLIALGVASMALDRRLPRWLRGTAGVLGLAAAVVFVVGSFASPVTAAPPAYLVPYGLLLGGIGLAYLAVSVAIVSESPFVVLTRRELAAYFFSPIAYIVLLGVAAISAVGYWLFLNIISGETVMEPMLQHYVTGNLIGPLVVPFLVPALTMRLLSEERRTGTLEVLLTAPVSEAVVVLSKFLACWLFYMLCWVPLGVYLIGLRVEGSSTPFDYRPLLSFYLAVGASGMAFIAIGLFFSSLTRNQIVAAVLTFVTLLVLLVLMWAQNFEDLGPVVRAALQRLAYWELWGDALRGQLSVRDVILQLSVAVFGLFLTVKILEARKWS